MTKTAEDVQFWIIQIMSRMAQSHQYDSWSDEFARKESGEALASLQKKVKEEVDLASFTDAELKSLGFKYWSEECAMRLVPLWAVKALRDGTRLWAIDGELAIVGKDEIDDDVRFGCIAYGLIPENGLTCLVKGCTTHKTIELV